MSEKYVSWVTLRPQWDRCRQGIAKMRILNFKTTWLEFKKANQSATKRVNGKLLYHTSEFHHLPRVGPKQLCALAHLGCTCAAGTS